ARGGGHGGDTLLKGVPDPRVGGRGRRRSGCPRFASRRGTGLLEQDIPVARAERRLGPAPELRLLPPVVDDDAHDDGNADREEADLQVTHIAQGAPPEADGRAAAPARIPRSSNGPVVHAAAASRMRSASSMSTATTRETPCSGIVTPISWAASSMVILLWLMKRNWVWSAIFRTRPQNRSVLVSSSGAPPSSSRQNGAGFSWTSANTSEIAVSAFSPPESRWIVEVRFPGGWARTSIPASRISSPVISSRASPPPNSIGKSAPKWRVGPPHGGRGLSRASPSI